MLIKTEHTSLFSLINSTSDYLPVLGIKIKLSRRRLYPTATVKYVGVKIDENFNWHHQINDLAAKLNRANALLFKIRN